MSARIGLRVAQFVAGALVLTSLALQLLIFEALAVTGYGLWPVLVGFVAIVTVLAPGPEQATRRRRSVVARRGRRPRRR
ncbi:hypothetical protein [Halomonas denitrificans]|nr:hypothetical protein [Halomonas denitrificans]